MYSPFFRINNALDDQEWSLVSINTMLHSPIFAGCCECCKPIRLGGDPDQNHCPICGRVMEMHRIPTLWEDFQLLVTAGYIRMQTTDVLM
jgi:hypothetical protein